MLSLLKESGSSNATIQLTGEPDVGKTSMALETGALPSQTVFIDSDVKGVVSINQLGGPKEFGMYRDVIADIGGMMLETAIHDYYMEIISEIEALDPEKRRVIIFDTWELFEKTLKPVVSKNPSKFREKYSPMGSIRGAEEWLASFDYEDGLISRISSMCELFILVSHVKNYNIGGQRVVGKFVPDCKKPVVRKTLLRLWLRHNPKSAVPIGLVMKRINLKRVTDRGIRTVNILPRRVTPREEDGSLWDTIRWYWQNPIGNRAPEPHEVPNEFELSILDGTLTDDQKTAFKAALVQEAQEEELFGDSKLDEAKEMQEKGKSFVEIAEYFGKSVPEVVAWLNE